MRRTIEITTSAYDKPYITDCMYEDGETSLKLRWKQRHDGDIRETVYDLSVDKAAGIVTIKRTGEIKSVLKFDTAKKTMGVFRTPYGEITISVVTHYINMPSVLTNTFEIGYDICHDDGNKESNTFTVRLV